MTSNEEVSAKKELNSAASESTSSSLSGEGSHKKKLTADNLAVASGSTSSSSKGESISVKTLSAFVTVQKRGNDVFVRYHITKEDRFRALKMIEATKLASRHPNTIMPLVAIKHRDGSVDVDAEYADAGPLCIYLPFFPLKARIAAAKSVARQIITALFYMDVVHDRQHRNVCPTTVFLRRDGCVKLGFFDVVDANAVEQWPDWFINSPFCAPEFRVSVTERLRMDAKGDIWAVGAVIVAIMLGKTLQPKLSKPRANAAAAAAASTSDASTVTAKPGEGETEDEGASTVATGISAAAGKSVISDAQTSNAPASTVSTTVLRAPTEVGAPVTAGTASEAPSGMAATVGEPREETTRPPNVGREDIPQPTDAQRRAYDEERQLFEDLVTRGSDDMWQTLIPDDSLRHLARRCLRIDARHRASLAESAALTHFLGGCKFFTTQAEIDENLAKVAADRKRAEEEEARRKAAEASYAADAAAAAASSSSPSARVVRVSFANDAAAAASQAESPEDFPDEWKRAHPTPTKPNCVKPHACIMIPDGIIHEPRKYPDPFMTDGKVLVDSNEPGVESAGAALREELLKMPPLYDNARNPSEICIRNWSVEVLRGVSILLHLELQSWKKLRESIEKRAKIDKAMREIVKNRQSFAWQTMTQCIADAREVISCSSKPVITAPQQVSVSTVPTMAFPPPTPKTGPATT